MTDRNVDNFLSDAEIKEIIGATPSVNHPVTVKNTTVSDTAVDFTPEIAPDSSTASKPLDEHSSSLEKEELEPQTNSVLSEKYFDDDEEFLRGDDKPIHENFDIALFKQEDNVVSWEIVNFYKDGATPRGKNALRNDPPIMKISSSTGDTAEFLVTKEFSRSLGAVLKDVNRAYYGISPSSKSEKLTQEGIKERFRSIGQWMLNHKIKTAVAVVVVALLMIPFFP